MCGVIFNQVYLEIKESSDYYCFIVSINITFIPTTKPFELVQGKIRSFVILSEAQNYVCEGHVVIESFKFFKSKGYIS